MRRIFVRVPVVWIVHRWVSKRSHLASRPAVPLAEAVLLPMGANPMLALVGLARGRIALAGERFTEAYDHFARIFDPDDVAYQPFVRGWALADIVDAAVYAGRELIEVRGLIAKWGTIAARTRAGHLRHNAAARRVHDHARLATSRVRSHHRIPVIALTCLARSTLAEARAATLGGLARVNPPLERVHLRGGPGAIARHPMQTWSHSRTARLVIAALGFAVPISLAGVGGWTWPPAWGPRQCSSWTSRPPAWIRARRRPVVAHRGPRGRRHHHPADHAALEEADRLAHRIGGAGLIAFLVSDAAAPVGGVILPADGAQTGPGAHTLPTGPRPVPGWPAPARGASR
jgi:hypothetical protein